MRRKSTTLLTAALALTLMVTACSNENEPKSKKRDKPSAAAPVDSSGVTTTTAAGSSVGVAPVAPGSLDPAALSAALTDWALNTAKATYPDVSPPTWSGADDAVLAYLPAGADAVAFCQALNDHLTESLGAGFDSVSITVIQDMSNTEPLASSDAGAPCS